MGAEVYELENLEKYTKQNIVLPVLAEQMLLYYHYYL